MYVLQLLKCCFPGSYEWLGCYPQPAIVLVWSVWSSEITFTRKQGYVLLASLQCMLHIWTPGIPPPHRMQLEMERRDPAPGPGLGFLIFS